tara:strand:- start:2872 stop:3267 length:396 start_codon:yes stop_codon:yes gene_type:complete
MFLVSKSNNNNNISFSYNKKYNFYKILYNTSYIKTVGISLKITYDKISINNNKYYIYIKDNNVLNILKALETYIKNQIPKFVLLRGDNEEKYIISKKYTDKLLNNKDLNIILYKIKYIDYKDSYIPIINII